MKKASVMLFILLGVISTSAQKPTGAGAHTPIIHSHEDMFPMNSVKKSKRGKKHSPRRLATR